MSKGNREQRRELGVGVMRFADLAGVSSRTVQDVEAGERKMRRETATKFARAWAKLDVDPTSIEEVSEALGIGPRYQRPDLDTSEIYRDEELRGEIASLVERAVERRLAELEAELRAELRRVVDREVERKVSERIAALGVRNE